MRIFIWLIVPKFARPACVARSDERTARSPVVRAPRADAFFRRRASLWIYGELVHFEDIVLHDTTRDSAPNLRTHHRPRCSQNPRHMSSRPPEPASWAGWQRLMNVDQTRFTNKSLRTVQMAVKAWRQEHLMAPITRPLSRARGNSARGLLLRR